MSTLIEVAEFISSVLRLDLDTPVRGFDGKTIGPSNEQAQTLANRTLWLKENIARIDGLIEALKDPDQVMKKHLFEKDPHEQYLTKERGNDLYLDKGVANVPNGYLQLDENGLLPSKIAKLYEARYLIVDDEKARLALEESKNITICLQLSDNIVYYLNPNTDPSIDAGWERGETTDINNVVSVFGRSGFIIPEAGDYNTSQITETEEKLFVSPDEKKAWSGKQDTLVSGVNASTVFGKSLLSGEDITLADIVELNKIIGKLLVGKNGIDIKVDEENKQLVIEGSGAGLKELRVFEVEDAVAGKRYNYPLVGEQSFDFQSYAFIRSAHKEEGEIVIDSESIAQNTSFSPVPDYDPTYKRFKAGSPMSVTMTSSSGTPEKFSSKDIELPDEDTCALIISVEQATQDVIPIFTADGTKNGATPISSEIYGAFNAWKSFQAPMTATERKKVPNKGCWSDNQYWKNRKTEVFLGIAFKTYQPVSAYSFQNFESFYWGGNSAAPKDWLFQGRDGDGQNWVTIDQRNSQTIMRSGNTWSKYVLSKPANYKQYRILVTGVTPESGRTAIPRLQFHTEPGVLIKDAKGNYKEFTESGVMTSLIDPTIEDFIPKTMTKPGVFTTARLPFPIKICSNVNGKVTVQFYKKESLIGIFEPGKDPDKYTDLTVGLDKLAATQLADSGDATAILSAFTVNGEDYYTLSNDEWTEIGKVSNDPNGADSVVKYGIPAGDLVNITSEKWKELLEKEVNSEFKIAFAKKLSLADGSVMPTELTVYSSPVTEWTKVSPDKVEVILTEKYLSFRPLVEGTYKFCYRFM